MSVRYPLSDRPVSPDCHPHWAHWNSSRRTALLLSVVLVLFTFSGMPLIAQPFRTAEHSQIVARFDMLVKQERYREAIPLAEQILAHAKSTLNTPERNAYETLEYQNQALANLYNAIAELYYKAAMPNPTQDDLQPVYDYLEERQKALALNNSTLNTLGDTEYSIYYNTLVETMMVPIIGTLNDVLFASQLKIAGRLRSKPIINEVSSRDDQNEPRCLFGLQSVPFTIARIPVAGISIKDLFKIDRIGTILMANAVCITIDGRDNRIQFTVFNQSPSEWDEETIRDGKNLRVSPKLVDIGLVLAPGGLSGWQFLRFEFKHFGLLMALYFKETPVSDLFEMPSGETTLERYSTGNQIVSPFFIGSAESNTTLNLKIYEKTSETVVWEIETEASKSWTKSRLWKILAAYEPADSRDVDESRINSNPPDAIDNDYYWEPEIPTPTPVPSPLPAPHPTPPIENDTASVTIKDEKGTAVVLAIPESMNNDQCKRRLFGTPDSVAGMFMTLYHEGRRIESYEAAIREMCMQPKSTKNHITSLQDSMRSAGVALDDIQLVLSIVNQGVESIDKKYIKGGSLTASVRNRLAQVGRQMNSAKKNPAFAQACLALENLNATSKLTETITGAFLLNSLSTDQAWMRLQEIKRIVELDQQTRGSVDPALEKAIRDCEENLLAARNKLGAFAVSVNDNIDQIAGSALNLGTSLAEISSKISAPVAMWVGAPLMAYNALKGVSDQWEMAQDAVSLATITKMIERQRKYQGDEAALEDLSLYGHVAFYSELEEVFSSGGAKLHDMLSPGQANRDWSQYYAEIRKKLESLYHIE